MQSLEKENIEKEGGEEKKKGGEKEDTIWFVDVLVTREKGVEE